MTSRTALQCNTHRDKPLHQVRHVPPPPRHKAERADPNYQPGYFSELVYKHRWPPRFQPKLRNDYEQWRSINAAANRQRRVDAGDTGTIVGLSHKSEEARLLSRIRMTR